MNGIYSWINIRQQTADGCLENFINKTLNFSSRHSKKRNKKEFLKPYNLNRLQWFLVFYCETVAEVRRAHKRTHFCFETGKTVRPWPCVLWCYQSYHAFWPPPYLWAKRRRLVLNVAKTMWKTNLHFVKCTFKKTQKNKPKFVWRSAKIAKIKKKVCSSQTL